MNITIPISPDKQPQVGDIWRYDCSNPHYDDHWLILEELDAENGGYLVYNMTYGMYEKISMHLRYERDLWIKVA